MNIHEIKEGMHVLYKKGPLYRIDKVKTAENKVEMTRISKKPKTFECSPDVLTLYWLRPKVTLQYEGELLEVSEISNQETSKVSGIYQKVIMLQKVGKPGIIQVIDNESFYGFTVQAEGKL